MCLGQKIAYVFDLEQLQSRCSVSAAHMEVACERSCHKFTSSWLTRLNKRPLHRLEMV